MKEYREVKQQIKNIKIFFKCVSFKSSEIAASTVSCFEHFVDKAESFAYRFSYQISHEFFITDGEIELLNILPVLHLCNTNFCT